MTARSDRAWEEAKQRVLVEAICLVRENAHVRGKHPVSLERLHRAVMRLRRFKRARAVK